MIPFIQNSRKCKLIYSDRKKIKGCIQMSREGIIKGHGKTFWSGRYIYCLDYHNGFTGMYICKNLSTFHFKWAQFHVSQLYLNKWESMETKK